MPIITASKLVHFIDQLPKDINYKYINPKNKGLIRIVGIDFPEGPIRFKRWIPSHGQSEITVREESISSQMIDRIANAIQPNLAINVDTLFGSSYNTRSVLEALLAHTSEFYYCYPGRIESNTSNSKIRKGHKHLLWLPNEPHNLGQIAEAKTEQVISEIPSQSAIFGTKIVINRYKKTAQYFIEELGNGIELEMVLIPGGSFIMGSPEEELESTNDERPQHQVTIKPFSFGKYPVTQAQWQVVAALPQVNQELKLDPSRFKGANRPVESVSWHDAVEFCARLSNHSQRPYRLPNEAEWEYACRAGTTTPFHFGETITTDLANYNGDYTYGDGVKGVRRGETTEVGSFKIANEFGLYDMHGNVWEWCQDDRHNSYEGAPTDCSTWIRDKSNSDIKVLRGGSWFNYPENCRSAFRGYHVAGFDSYNNGFRVVCGAAWTL